MLSRLKRKKQNLKTYNLKEKECQKLKSWVLFVKVCFAVLLFSGCQKKGTPWAHEQNLGKRSCLIPSRLPWTTEHSGMDRLSLFILQTEAKGITAVLCQVPPLWRTRKGGSLQERKMGQRVTTWKGRKCEKTNTQPIQQLHQLST